LLQNDFEAARASLTAADRQYASVVDGPEWRTILRAGYQHFGIDQRDPRILLGYELAVAALNSIMTRCRRESVDLLVVLLPTKESVFWPRITDPDQHPGLREVARDESMFRERLIGHLGEIGIKVLDPLRALRTAATQPYYEHTEGHPNAEGHRIIAERIAEALLGIWPARPSTGPSPSGPVKTSDAPLLSMTVAPT
jgi:hypothetical protein